MTGKGWQIIESFRLNGKQTNKSGFFEHLQPAFELLELYFVVREYFRLQPNGVGYYYAQIIGKIPKSDVKQPGIAR